MSSQQSTANTSSARGLWVLVAALVSLLAAVVAGILTVVGHGSVAQAFIHGGEAFVAIMTLALLVLAALRVL